MAPPSRRYWPDARPMEPVVGLVPGSALGSFGVTVWAIVPAGGSGSRFGGQKQFVELGGATLLDRCIAALLPVVDGVVVAIPAGAAPTLPPGVRSVVGGATRLESVRAALAAVPQDADVIVVHGPSHPLASVRLTEAVVDAVRDGADAAFPGLPVVDALKRVGADGAVEATVAKDGLVTAQTPQAFHAATFRAVHAGSPESAEDSELIERAGGRVAVTPGAPGNLHIATPADLDLAEAILAGSSDRTTQ